METGIEIDRLTETVTDRPPDRPRERERKSKNTKIYFLKKKNKKMDAKSGRFFALNCDIPAPLPSSKFFCLQQTAPS